MRIKLHVGKPAELTPAPPWTTPPPPAHSSFSPKSWVVQLPSRAHQSLVCINKSSRNRIFAFFSESPTFLNEFLLIPKYLLNMPR